MTEPALPTGVAVGKKAKTNDMTAAISRRFIVISSSRGQLRLFPWQTSPRLRPWIHSGNLIRAEHADADSEPCALLGAGRELRPDHTADPGRVRSYRPHLVCNEMTQADNYRC